MTLRDSVESACEQRSSEEGLGFSPVRGPVVGQMTFQFGDGCDPHPIVLVVPKSHRPSRKVRPGDIWKK